MSAYIVDKDTIDVLVSAASAAFAASGELRFTSAQAAKLGQDLWDENVRSVSYRYSSPGRVVCYGEAYEEESESDGWDLPGSYVNEEIAPGMFLDVPQWLTPYTHEPVDITRESVETAVKCYAYQSCEHPEWEDSFAAGFVANLRSALDDIPAAPEPEDDSPSLEEMAERYGDLSREQTIKRIRQALRRRSGKAWSVTGGRGTGYGWIRIESPPARRTGKRVARPGGEFGEYDHVDTGQPQEFGIMTPADCEELGALLGLGRPSHHQGESIPSSNDYRREYIDRAEGREIREHGRQYWD